MVVLDRLPRETGREYALRTLRENIIQLHLAPGTKVSENELAAELGISRTPVREALLELSKVDIVEVYPQKGSAISLIDNDQVDEALFLREVLEQGVVERCCKVITPEDLKILHDMIDLQRYYAEREHPTVHLQMDNQFHAKLFAIAGKPRVFTMMSNMAIHLDRIRTLTLSNIPRSEVTEEHVDIIAAIEANDPEEAKRCVTRHVSRFHTVDHDLHDRFAAYYKP